MRKKTRDSGIDIIGEVPWGTHFCQFYQTREDLIDILVPYFKTGLENNELCIWITSHPLEVEEAKEAMKKAVPEIDTYLEKGQIEIVPYTHGYLREGNFDPEKEVNSWIEKINQALARGYEGLRVAGDNRWLDKEGWKGFVDYENKVDAIIDKHRVIGLCPYYLNMCSIAEIIDVVSNNQFALIKREGKWERIENSGRKRAEKEAIQAAKNWEYTFDAVPDLIAIIDDKYRVVRANRAMAARLDLTPEECAGLTCYRVIHGTENPPSFCPHEQLFKDGAEHTAEICEDCLGGYFSVSTSPIYDSEGKLIGSVYVARDINERKREEHRIRRYNRILDGINQIFSNVVQAKTEEELGEACLSVALEVTGSEFGFINEMGTDGVLHDVAKSELAWERCFMYDKTGHRLPPSVFAVHGLYGSIINNEKGFFTNDPQSHPDSIGIPDGHPPITSFLGVPLIQDGNTIGLIAVANREGGYSSEQQDDLEAIAPAVVQALQRKRVEQKRKQAEKALQVSEARYRSLYENSLDGILLTKPDGTILSANPEACHMFGMTEDEIKRVGREGTVVNDEKLAAALEERKRTGRMRAELTHRRKDGSTFVCDTTSQLFIDADGSTSTSLIIRDVTERKRAEEALSRERSLLGSIMQATDVMLVFLDTQFNFVWVNPAYAETCQMKPEEMVGKNHFALYPHAENEAIFRHVRDTGEGIFYNDKPFVFPDQPERGTTYWDWSLAPVKDSGGNVTGLVFSLRETTKHKQAEEALRESEEKFRDLVEHVNDWVWEIDTDCVYKYVSPRARELLGYDPTDLLGTTPFDYMNSEEADRARSLFYPIFNEREEFFLLENTLIRKDGGTVTVETSGVPIYNSQGNFSGYRGIDRDITERKRAEEALRLSNLYNRSLIEASLDPLVTIGHNGKINDVNNATEQVTGYLRRELIGTDFSDYFTEPEKARSGYQQVFMDGEVRDYPLEIQHKDGHITPVLYNASVYRDESGKVIGVFAAARDITERKRADKALQKSQAELSKAQLISQIGSWTWDLVTNEVTWSEQSYRNYGLVPGEVEPSYELFLSFVVPEDRERVDREVRKAIESGHKYRITYNIIRTDGTPRILLSENETVMDESGKIVLTYGTNQDITERKKAEEALKKAHDNLEKIVEERTTDLEKAYNSLKESERGLAEAQKMTHIGNWEWDIAADKAYWSEEMYRIFGRDPQKLAPSLDEYLSYIHPDDLDYYRKVNDYTTNIRTSGLDFRIILADGEERTLHIKSDFIYNDENIPVRVKGTVQDITERKKTEEKIQILANAVESSSDAIITVSLEGIITSWNKAAEQVYGYSAQETVGKSVSVLAPFHLRDETKKLTEMVIQGEKVHQYETLRLRKDSTLINVSITLSPVFDVTGKLVAISGIVRDVTERIRAEDALRESEARMRLFYESDMLGVCYYNLDGSITDANDRFLGIIGYTREDLRAGKVNWNKMTPPEYRSLDEQSIAELETTGLKGPKEKEYIRKDGSRVPVIVGAATFDKVCNGGTAFVLDITENKKTQKALANIEITRKKEIHHRIKNNLQVISSLLDLQADKFDDPKVIEAFRESQNRVVSMALIHEELYKGEGTDTLDFCEYIKELTENLFRTYSLSSKNIDLKMDLEKDAFFNMDVAVPLGIIVNELVSNSLKHAFQGRDIGEIRIELHRQENGEHKKEGNKVTSFILTVSDNGIGIPDNSGIHDLDTLGMQLISALVDQLDGKLELKRNNGTEFNIRFTVIEENDQVFSSE